MCKDRPGGPVEHGSNPDLYLIEEAEAVLSMFLQIWAMGR